MFLDAADEEFHSEQCLAATGTAADEGWSAAWKAAASDGIEAADAARAFR
jgi:hypothetical protein